MRRYYFSFLLSLCFILIYGQQKVDTAVQQNSLLQKTYDELKQHFNDAGNNVDEKEYYAKVYLEKSIQDKNTIRQANAYYFLSGINRPPVSVHYADSIILLTTGIKNNVYPAKGFIRKGFSLYQAGKYKDALDQWIKADEYATRSNNEVQQLEIKYFIGTLKNDMEEHQEALEIFRVYFQEIEKKYNEDERYISNYIKGLYALGDSYNRNGLYDSATAVNKKGFELALKNKAIDPIYFTMSMGVTAYLTKDYQAGLDSLQKSAKRFVKNNDPSSLTICYLYIGRIKVQQKKTDDAILYFKKVDSVVTATSDVFPDILDAYVFLNNHYESEEKNDLKNQLKYVNRLLEINSLLNVNYKYISKTSKKYDIEALERRRKEIERELWKRQLIWIISLSIVILLISGFAYYYYRKQKKYRIKFEELLQEKKVTKKQPSKKAVTLADLNMLEEKAKQIKEQLKLFIEEKRFLENDVSVNNWAKAIKTNSRHLSEYINRIEQKNFTKYITDLRIDYVVERLKVDPILRKYNIRSVAEEIGFNNVQSFSKAFRKITRLYPSYFIKELEKEELRKKNQNSS